ncbi:MAG: hypothetical protein ACYC6M_16775 [Terriglobales bacterium]
MRRPIPLLTLLRVVQRLQGRVRKRCRVQKRGWRPSLDELLLDPDRGSVLAEQQHEEDAELQAA